MTKAYKLKSKIILHISADRFHDNWEAGIVSLFKKADVNGVRTIAMPALGTGLLLFLSL